MSTAGDGRPRDGTKRRNGRASRRRTPPMDDRRAARRRHSHQLLRSREHLGRGPAAPAGIRADARPTSGSCSAPSSGPTPSCRCRSAWCSTASASCRSAGSARSSGASASGAVAFATGFGTIFAARVLLGVAEAPAFPANSKATGYWFPRGERALATAIFDAAAKFSNVIGVPLVAFAVVAFGWRWGFGLTAVLSFAYFVAYWIIYRDPSADAKLSREECELYPRRAARRPRALPRPVRSRCSATSCRTARCGG